MMTPTLKPDWQNHIETGNSYLKTARNGLKRPMVFNNELIYQLTAMAIEKFLVGVHQFHRQMPADHTLDGLVNDLAGLCHLDRDLAEGVKSLGRMDNMCPLTPANRIHLSDIQIKVVLDLGEQVADFAHDQVNQSHS